MAAALPEIFNTDLGFQFIGLLKDHVIRIFMVGKSNWRDNTFIEQRWKSDKYEEGFLRAYDSVTGAKAGLGGYLDFYDTRRPHSSLDGKTPDTIYFAALPVMDVAA